MKVSFLLLILALMLGFKLHATDDFRAWTDVDGRTIDARVLDFDGDSAIRIELRDGRAFTLQINRLSTLDREWLDSWEKPKAAASKILDRYAVIEWLSREFKLREFSYSNTVPRRMHGPVRAQHAWLPDPRPPSYLYPDRPTIYTDYRPEGKIIGFFKKDGMDWRGETDIPYAFLASASTILNRRVFVILISARQGDVPDVIILSQFQIGDTKYDVTEINYHVNKQGVTKFHTQLVGH
jgi:hypothetical protein